MSTAPVEQDLGREYLWRGQRPVRTVMAVGLVAAVLLVTAAVAGGNTAQGASWSLVLLGDVVLLALFRRQMFTHVEADGVHVRPFVVSSVTVITWAQVAAIEAVVRQEPRWRYCIARTRTGEQLRLPGALSTDVADLVATARRHLDPTPDA